MFNYRSAGRAKVTVAFSCSFGNQNGIVETRDYSASETIWVVPDPPLALGIPATWLLRPQYTSSSLLPQWTGQFPARIDNGNFVQSVQYTVMHVSIKVCYHVLFWCNEGQHLVDVVLTRSGVLLTKFLTINNINDLDSMDFHVSEMKKSIHCLWELDRREVVTWV